MLRSYREYYVNFNCSLVSQMSRNGIGERVVSEKDDVCNLVQIEGEESGGQHKRNNPSD